MAKLALLTTFAALLPFTLAQVAEWGQCGGIGYTGSVTCAAGTFCMEYSAYYSQCIPGTASGSTSSTPTATSSSAAPSGTSTAGLNAAAQAVGKKYFGSATDNPELTDAPYVAILSEFSEFGQITPGNSMKWDATEPSQGDFSFTGGQQIVALARGNGQIIRGHNCVWYNQLPSWVTSGNFNATELTSIVETHCGTIVGHWAGEISRPGVISDNELLTKFCKDAWDVINEAFNDDGTWRSDVFYNTLGTSFVPAALNAARAADPTAKLYINDYNIEYTGPKATALLNLVQQLQANGTPIDGVGFQCHFIVGEVSTSFQTVLEQFTALGIEVAITELDIRMTLPSTDALLQQQKTDYENVIKACNAVEGCIGMTVWDYTDKYSWVPSTFSGQGAACPWDENLVTKPAYDGIIAALT